MEENRLIYDTETNEVILRKWQGPNSSPKYVIERVPLTESSSDPEISHLSRISADALVVTDTDIVEAMQSQAIRDDIISLASGVITHKELTAITNMQELSDFIINKLGTSQYVDARVKIIENIVKASGKPYGFTDPNRIGRSADTILSQHTKRGNERGGLFYYLAHAWRTRTLDVSFDTNTLMQFFARTTDDTAKFDRSTMISRTKLYLTLTMVNFAEKFSNIFRANTQLEDEVAIILQQMMQDPSDKASQIVVAGLVDALARGRITNEVIPHPANYIQRNMVRLAADENHVNVPNGVTINRGSHLTDLTQTPMGLVYDIVELNPGVNRAGTMSEAYYQAVTHVIDGNPYLAKLINAYANSKNLPSPKTAKELGELIRQYFIDIMTNIKIIKKQLFNTGAPRNFGKASGIDQFFNDVIDKYQIFNDFINQALISAKNSSHSQKYLENRATFYYFLLALAEAV